ncbi:hypothetical protein D3C72_1665520 [compost metagenome]
MRTARGTFLAAMPHAAAISSAHSIGISTTLPGPSLNCTAPMVSAIATTTSMTTASRTLPLPVTAAIGEAGASAGWAMGLVITCLRGKAAYAAQKCFLRHSGSMLTAYREDRASIPAPKRFINDRDMGNSLHSMQRSAE